MIGILDWRAPERHDSVADEFVDGSELSLNLARHGVEIGAEQRDDPVAEALRQSSEARKVGKQYSHGSHRAARLCLDAGRYQQLDHVSGEILAERRKAVRHVGDCVGKVVDLGEARRMTAHMVEIEPLDMLEL